MKKQLKQDGITLIALVITIIVLIILAGVTINMLVGENGIITQAQKAKEDTEKAKIEEEQAINHLYDTIMTEGKVNVIDKTVEQMKEEGSYMGGNTQIKDSKGNKVIIPGGFKIATDSSVNIVDGIVIEDKKQNQFVWVPSNKSILKEDNTLAKDENQFVESVSQYKGFYVARYEAGLENAILENKENSNNDEYWTAWKETELVSKKDKIVWNYITAKKANELANNMYKENSYVKSRLVSSNAWDTIIEFISDAVNVDGNIIDSTSYGNYRDATFTIDSINAQYSLDGTNYLKINKGDSKAKQQNYLLTTGATEYTKTKNIYDLAGNVRELTSKMEEQNYFIRAGHYTLYGANSPINYSATVDSKVASDSLSFRVVLYL